MALALAEVGLSFSSDPLLLRTSALDDVFVTGFLREKVPGLEVRCSADQCGEGALQVRQLAGGLEGVLWDHALSHCTW